MFFRVCHSYILFPRSLTIYYIFHRLSDKSSRLFLFMAERFSSSVLAQYNIFRLYDKIKTDSQYTRKERV